VTAPFGRTVGLVRRTKGKPDALGNDTFSEVTTPATAVLGLRTGAEQVQGRDTLVEHLSIFLAADTVITALDAVDIDGQRWEVDGTPTAYLHALTGWKPGVEVGLRRVAG
jgi:hypothetical protein